MSKIHVTILVLIYVTGSIGLRPTPWTPIPEIIKMEHYPVETHTLETSDGYILKNFRIPNKDTVKPPLILLHGVMSSSKDFLLMGNRSFAFVAANAGYDVWLVNMRFTEEARHKTISRKDYRFWDFGFEESAAVDLPESIDQILKITNSSKVSLIGLSAGNVLYVMLCTLRPDLVDKIAFQISLAPAWYVTKFQTAQQEAFNPEFLKQLNGIGWNHVILSNDLRKFLMTYCKQKTKSNMCFSMTFQTMGTHWNNVDWDNADLLFSRYVALTFKQFYHMVQNGRSTVGFSRYDYGPNENMKRYGSKKAPLFDQRACTAPRVVYYGKNDKVTPLKEAKKLVDQIRGPNNKIYLKYPKSKLFNHVDYFFGKRDTDILYKDLIEVMKMF